MNRHFTKEDVHMVNKHRKDAQHHLSSWKCKLITTVRYHYVPIKKADTQKTDTTNYW